jgi:hypothetical protein
MSMILRTKNNPSVAEGHSNSRKRIDDDSLRFVRVSVFPPKPRLFRLRVCAARSS